MLFTPKGGIGFATTRSSSATREEHKGATVAAATARRLQLHNALDLNGAAACVLYHALAFNLGVQDLYTSSELTIGTGQCNTCATAICKSAARSMKCNAAADLGICASETQSAAFGAMRSHDCIMVRGKSPAAVVNERTVSGGALLVFHLKPFAFARAVLNLLARPATR